MEQADDEGGHHQGQGDIAGGLKGRAAVDTGRLKQVVGHAGKSGHIDDHHIARILPDRHHHQRPERHGGIAQPGAGEQIGSDAAAEAGQRVIEHKLPDEAEDDTADEVGGEKGGSQKILTLDAAGQQIGQEKGHQVDEDHRRGHVAEGQQQGMPERRVFKGGHIVLKRHEARPVGNAVPVGKGQHQAVQEGDFDRIRMLAAAYAAKL